MDNERYKLAKLMALAPPPPVDFKMRWPFHRPEPEMPGDQPTADWNGYHEELRQWQIEKDLDREMQWRRKWAEALLLR